MATKKLPQLQYTHSTDASKLKRKELKPKQEKEKNIFILLTDKVNCLGMDCRSRV